VQNNNGEVQIREGLKNREKKQRIKRESKEQGKTKQLASLKKERNTIGSKKGEQKNKKKNSRNFKEKRKGLRL
jgi:hypothetical protein